MDFQIEKLYEEKDESEDLGDIPLIKVKGIGEGTVESLHALDIGSLEDLISADPKDLASKLSGASSNTVLNWQKNAKALKI